MFFSPFGYQDTYRHQN